MRRIDLLKFPRIKRALGCRSEGHRIVARRFDREFFDGSRDVGYGGYTQDGRWSAVALRMLLHYGLAAGARVLDIGCAKGFLVQAFRDLGVEAYGIDISAYAISQSACPRYTIAMDVRDLSGWSPGAMMSGFDLVVSINTLHNLPRKEMASTLRTLGMISRHQYITLDSWTNEPERMRMMAWNLTAQTMMSETGWVAFFRDIGYVGDYDWFTP